MRKLIAGMRMSVDGKVGGPDGYADWVEEWSDQYGVTSRVDACVLGAGMYPGYEGYWSAIQKAPHEPAPMTGKLPTPAEVEYARFTARTPHYVLSGTLSSANWSNTSFLRGLAEVKALKQQPGKDIYLVGGARIVAALLDAGLVDELELRVEPLIVGPGLGLFAGVERRQLLELAAVRKLESGRVGLTYRLG